VKTQKLKKH